MKITLISPCQRDIYAPGMRALSAYLKLHGHSVRMVFLPGDLLALRHDREMVLTYPPETINRLIDLAGDSRIVGLSFLSQYLDAAASITRAFRERTDKLVVWGGIHATVHPESCLDHAEAVCEGEGESSMIELIRRVEAGKDFSDVPGLWVRREGKTVRNEPSPLIQDLDSLPFIDYSLDDDWLYNDRIGRLVKIDDEVLSRAMPMARDRRYRLRVMYRTMSDRGCPFACTYCIGSTLREKYRGQRYRRARSIEHTIAELVQVTKRYPFIGLIHLIDDTFFIRPQREIDQFAAEYKAKIHLPLHLQGSPTTITEERLTPLMDAGLCFVEMGVQTAHKPTQIIYNRRGDNRRVLDVARMIHRHSDRLLPPCYHLILDNPWEPDEGVEQTLRLMLRIPSPYRVAIGSLTFFPGTPLYFRAKQEGLCRDEFHDIYRKPINWAKGNIRNTLVVATGCAMVPRPLIKLLGQPRVLRWLDRREWSPGYARIIRGLHLLSRVEYVLRSLLVGDLSIVGRALRRMVRPPRARRTPTPGCATN